MNIVEIEEVALCKTLMNASFMSSKVLICLTKLPSMTKKELEDVFQDYVSKDPVTGMNYSTYEAKMKNTKISVDKKSSFAVNFKNAMNREVDDSNLYTVRKDIIEYYTLCNNYVPQKEFGNILMDVFLIPLSEEDFEVVLAAVKKIT